MKRAFLLLVLISAGGFGARPAAALETSPLVIVTRDGARHAFTVEIARTQAEKAQGLMFRRALAADAGMLFPYRRDRVMGFWMKNTLLPLDMLFIAADGTINSIAQRTVPRSLTAVSSRVAVRAVLELNGGATARLGIKPGDRILHPAFGNAQ